MALSYKKYPNISSLKPQLVTANLIDPNKILGLHQGSNGFANLVICIAEAWYLESVRELAKNNRSAIIDNWQKNYKLNEIGQPWCEVFTSFVYGEAIKNCGVTNLYPKLDDFVQVYKNQDGTVPQYNYSLTNTQIAENRLVNSQTSIFANAFRAKEYIKTKVRQITKVNDPIPGSKFYRYSEGNSSGHTGVVIAVLDGYFYTIEGNVVIDNGTLDEGVGMYRYPIIAAQDQTTGFEFYDFSRYPSNMGNLSCENNKFSYTYTGIDGKQKTRNCWKPVVEKTPDVVVETPPEEKTPDKPKTPDVVQPKKDCLPASGLFTQNASVETKQKVCKDFLTIKIPDISKDGGLLQHFTRLKDKYVQADIVDSDIYYALPTLKKFTSNEILKRNGSSLWYEADNQNTGKATGFGMFKDRVGNIIYVLDSNNPASEQLALSGLLGVDFPPAIIDTVKETGARTFANNWTLSKALWQFRDRFNYFGIRLSQSSDDDIYKMLKLERGIANSSNGLYNEQGEWMLGEEPMHIKIDRKDSLGLDYDSITNKYQYFIPFDKWHEVVNDSKYQTVKQKYEAGDRKDGFGLYNYINIYEVLSEIEKRNIVLKNPIVICFSKPTPKLPLLSQDFIAIVSTVAKIATMATGIPIPIDAIINGLQFAESLNAGIKLTDITQITRVANFAHQFAKGVAPDFVKGLESDVKKTIDDSLVAFKDSIGLTNGINQNGSPITIESVIAKLGGDAKAYGKYFDNARKGFDNFIQNNLSEASKLIGLNSTQLQELNLYFDNLETGFNNVFDLRNIVSGYNFKDVQKNYANLRVEFASNTIIKKLTGATGNVLIDSIKSQNTISSNPLIQEILINGGATNLIGMFPKAPQFASTLVNEKIKLLTSSISYNELQTKANEVKNINEQRANIVAAAFGYDLKICDIFANETINSLYNQARVYADSKIPFFMPVSLHPDISECYKFEVVKKLKEVNKEVDIINCPDGWNYDPKTNRCYNEKTTVPVDFGSSGKVDITVERVVPKCIQQSFGSYVFYYKGMPLVAVPTNDNRWIASWGGKNYFIDTVNCTLLGVPTDTSSPNEPPIITNTPPIPLPKCITIRNGKYWYNPRLSIGLNDNVIAKELTDLYANTKTPIGGASPEQLVSGGLDLAKVLGIDTSKVTNAVTNNPTVSSVIGNVNRVDNLINSLNQSAAPGTSKATSSPVVSNVTTPTGTTSSPVTSVLTSPNTSNVTITQVVGEEEAFLINGKWYLLRNGKYIEIIDCIPVAPKVYQCGIVEKDGGFVFNYNGKEYTAVKNYDDKFYVFINGIYYTLDANCNPITPKPGTRECDECEKLVEVEKQNRIKLEKAFSESKVSNDSKIKELINLLNTQTQKTQELEKQMILRSGGTSTNNDSKYNELLSQLQSERERVNQLQRLIEQSKTGGNNYDSIIEQINNSLRQEKERSNRLEIKIAELEKQKSNDYFTDIERRNDNDFRSDVTTDISKEEFREEKLPNCITLENGNYYFTGMVHKERLQLKALQTVKGWIAEYQSKYYYIDLANCTLLIDSKKIERSFTGECNDCVKNTQPRIVERKERIIYGGHQNRLDPEVYEDCDEC